MTVTWFSDGQPSYNTMVDIDTNMFNHVSTLFTTAGKSIRNDMTLYQSLVSHIPDQKVSAILKILNAREKEWDSKKESCMKITSLKN